MATAAKTNQGRKSNPPPGNTGRKSSPPAAQTNGPTKLDGSPDLRFRGNDVPGTAAYDSRHRNPHQGQPSPLRQRNDRPVGQEGDITNADGTLDMRFLENRIKAGLVKNEDIDNERAYAAENEPNEQPHRRQGRQRN
jgi:hypothetical protein